MEKRWVQRFENYKQALANFDETVACIKKEGLSKIYTMALIQAFEIVFELAWKTMKDYLEFSGIIANTPRETIKEAFSANIIADGQMWINMMEARNKTSYEYNEEFFQQVSQDILNNYSKQFANLSIYLESKIDN